MADPDSPRAVAEAAVHRLAGGGVLTATDVDPVADGVVRTTTVWQVGESLWRVVVDTQDGTHVVVEAADASGPGRGARGWDDAHAADRRIGEPDPTVLATVDGLRPGRALDLACGRGRHALRLAALGWDVTAVDFSRAGLARLSAAADTAGTPVTTVLADGRLWEPPAGERYDLVLLAFVHLPGVVSRAASWVAPGGRLVVVGHARRNQVDGVGGPRDPRLLHDHVDLAARVTGARLRVVRAAEVERATPDGTALDVVVVAENPSAAS